MMSESNPSNRGVRGIGFLGEGKYRSSTNGKVNPEYMRWASMFERCYSKKFQENNPTYKGCVVCEEWHNFQNFAKWYNENHPKDGEKYQLDKDKKSRSGRGKIYSPYFCSFVTPRENSMLALSRKGLRDSVCIGLVDDRVVYVFSNIAKFCRENKFNDRCVRRVISGGKNTHKGVRFRRVLLSDLMV